MKLGHIELLVRDTTASRRFYEEVLGFEVIDVQHEGAIVWLRCGDRELLLRPGTGAPSTPSYKGAAVGLVLLTEALGADRAKLESRGLRFEGDNGPGCPTFRDPDGNWWQLVDPRHP